METRRSDDGVGTGAVLTLYCVASLTIMVGCVLVPGLPAIATALGVPRAASWLITLPALGVVLGSPAAGAAIDRFGAYRSLCWGLVLYGGLGASGFLLRGPGTVFADRLLLGGATAVVMASGTAMVSQFFAGGRRLAVIARQGMAIELGGVVLLSLGGWLAMRDWRLPFALYLLAWAFLGMTVTLLRPQGFAAERAETNVEESAATGALRSVYVAACASMICFFVGITTLPLRLHMLGKAESSVGYFLGFVSLIAVAAAWAMPRGVLWLGARTLVAVAFCAYAGAHVVFTFASAWPALLGGGVLMGAGFGLTIPLTNHLVAERSAGRQRGSALARLSAAIFLGQFLSSFVTLLPLRLGGVFGFAAGLASLAALLVLCKPSLPQLDPTRNKSS